jgi:CubicO group peptidase (beta-lactamase class C family)
MLIQRIVLVCLIALLIAPLSQAQNAETPKLPNTQAGQRVAAYLKAFNSGDEGLMRDFFNQNVSPASLQERPVEARIGVYREMRANVETMELRRVLEAREDSISILVQTKKGELLNIGFEFEPETPHRFLRLRVEDAEAPSTAEANGGAPAPAMTEKEALAAVEKYLNEQVAADEFSGVVLVARNDAPLFQRAYGLASKEYNVPNRTDTKFNLGSINKIFTQIAVGQLVSQGKLAYDDKLGKYLADYPNREAAQKVTIRQLLSMRSGIGDFFGPKFDATPKNKLRTIKDFLPLFAGDPLAFEPGSKREYSNGGYIVLGAIIEKASGQDYYEYVREHIFNPAGMQNTDWYEADLPVQNLASGYTREAMDGRAGGARVNNIYTRPAKGSPAGGGYSTADDLLKLARALQTQKLRLPDFEQPGGTSTGKPVSFERRPEGFGGIGIAGGSLGLNALLEIGPDNGYTVIVMSNYDPPSAVKTGKQIRGLLAQVRK